MPAEITALTGHSPFTLTRIWFFSILGTDGDVCSLPSGHFWQDSGHSVSFPDYPIYKSPSLNPFKIVEYLSKCLGNSEVGPLAERNAAKRKGPARTIGFACPAPSCTRLREARVHERILGAPSRLPFQETLKRWAQASFKPLLWPIQMDNWNLQLNEMTFNVLLTRGSLICK